MTDRRYGTLPGPIPYRIIPRRILNITLSYPHDGQTLRCTTRSHTVHYTPSHIDLQMKKGALDEPRYACAAQRAAIFKYSNFNRRLSSVPANLQICKRFNTVTMMMDTTTVPTYLNYLLNTMYEMLQTCI